jgi:hypothetical protein
MMTDSVSASGAASSSGGIGLPSSRWKIVLSVLLVLHLLAVTAEPLRFFTRSSRGTSPATDPVRIWLAPYVEFAYLNHGYFFFAPEPGPSHLMECRLEFGDSKSGDAEVGRLRFPDKQAQRPRLLYHRHFMLAEFLHQLHVPPVEPSLVGDDRRLLADWQADRGRYEMIRDSMARHLVARYGANAAVIERVEHRLPSDVEVLTQRLPLNDPSLYVTLPDAPVFLPPDAIGPVVPEQTPPGLSKPLIAPDIPAQAEEVPQ